MKSWGKLWVLLLLIILFCIQQGAVSTFLSGPISVMSHILGMGDFSGGKYPNGIPDKRAREIDSILEAFDKYTMAIERISDDIVKRSIITKKEYYQDGYQKWKEFVIAYENHGVGLREVSIMQRSAQQQHTSIYADVYKLLNRNQLMVSKKSIDSHENPLPKLPNFVTKSKGNQINLPQDETRIKIGIRFAYKEYTELLAKWVEIKERYAKEHQNNLKLRSWATQSTQDSVDLLKKTKDGWNSAEKVAYYALPSILMAAATPLIGPILAVGAMFAATTTTATIHLFDRFQWKPDQQRTYEDQISKFLYAENTLEKIDAFISHNVASSTVIVSKMRTIVDQLNVLDADTIRDEFVDILLYSIDSFNNYMNMNGLSNKKLIKKYLVQKSISSNSPMDFELLCQQHTIYNDLINKNTILFYVSHEIFSKESDFFINEKMVSCCGFNGLVMSLNLENILHTIIKCYEKFSKQPELYLYIFRVNPDIVLNPKEFECVSETMVVCQNAARLLKFFSPIIKCVSLEMSVFKPLTDQTLKYTSSLSVFKNTDQQLYNERVRDQAYFLLRHHETPDLCAALITSLACGVLDGFDAAIPFDISPDASKRTLVFKEKYGVLWIFYLGSGNTNIFTNNGDHLYYKRVEELRIKLRNSNNSGRLINKVFVHKNQVESMKVVFKEIDSTWNCIDPSTSTSQSGLSHEPNAKFVPESWLFFSKPRLDKKKIDEMGNEDPSSNSSEKINENNEILFFTKLLGNFVNKSQNGMPLRKEKTMPIDQMSRTIRYSKNSDVSVVSVKSTLCIENPRKKTLEIPDLL